MNDRNTDDAAAGFETLGPLTAMADLYLDVPEYEINISYKLGEVCDTYRDYQK
jgi:hypothetical protein